MSASGQVTSANRAFRKVCGVVLSILAGLLLLLAFDILRPRNAPSFGMLLSRAWPALPIVGLCSLSLWAWSRAWRDRPQHAAVARRLRQVGLVFGVVVGMPVALMMVEYCCYEPVKFTYLIYRVEHAASPEAERAAFRLAARWGRVWELKNNTLLAPGLPRACALFARQQHAGSKLGAAPAGAGRSGPGELAESRGSSKRAGAEALLFLCVRGCGYAWARPYGPQPSSPLPHPGHFLSTPEPAEITLIAPPRGKTAEAAAPRLEQ